MIKMNDRIEAIARVHIKRELRKLGMDNESLIDMHDTKELITLWDEKRKNE